MGRSSESRLCRRRAFEVDDHIKNRIQEKRLAGRLIIIIIEGKQKIIKKNLEIARAHTRTYTKQIIKGQKKEEKHSKDNKLQQTNGSTSQEIQGAGQRGDEKARMRAHQKELS